MDNDLKIVLYIVGAIIWLIYNNYKKVAEETRKRDPSKPVGEVIEENWPKEPEAPKSAPRKSPVPKVLRKKPEPVPVPARKEVPVMKRVALSKPRMSSAYQSAFQRSAVSEGGSLQPSKMVKFEDPLTEQTPSNPWVEALRNADMRTAIVFSEIFKRPYN